MGSKKQITALAGCIATAFTIAACGGDETGVTAAATSTQNELVTSSTTSTELPQGSETVKLDPADFTTEIDNPYWPMSPGSKWVYEETDTKGSTVDVTVTVTNRTKTIANGVEARVVRDVATENGELIEATDDWYAQDSDGNIWYLGEDTAEYKNGKIATRAGSFEAGVGGAQAGIALPANPEPGMSYRQEYDKGNAEDRGAVVTVGEEQVQTPTGFYTDVLMTRDLVPLEPKVEELKFYVPDVGPVLSVHTDGTGGRGELVNYTPGN